MGMATINELLGNVDELVGERLNNWSNTQGTEVSNSKMAGGALKKLVTGKISPLDIGDVMNQLDTNLYHS